MKGFLTDNGIWSWRKGLTLMCAVLFASAVIGYLLKHSFEELPLSYQLIISGVFGFYFAKKAIDKIGSAKTEAQQ